MNKALKNAYLAFTRPVIPELTIKQVSAILKEVYAHRFTDEKDQASWRLLNRYEYSLSERLKQKKTELDIKGRQAQKDYTMKLLEVPSWLPKDDSFCGYIPIPLKF